MCYFNPKIDLVFKKLFGTEENKHYLLSVINSVLENASVLEKTEFIPIDEITIENPYNLPDYLSGKMTILDIKARDQNKIWYDIEIQLDYQGYFAQRAIYYWSQVYVNQIGKKGAYSQLNKVIFISFLDFQLIEGNEYHSIYRLLNTQTHKEIVDVMEMHFIELEKFELQHQRIKNTLDRWLMFLNNAVEYNKRKMPQELAENKTIVEAVKSLEVLSMDDSERAIYMDREKARADQINIITSAEIRAKEQGLQKGLQKGLKQGLKQGIEKGIEQGIEQGKIETAQNMLQEKIDITLIAKITTLSIPEIESLAKSLKPKQPKKK